MIRVFGISDVGVRISVATSPQLSDFDRCDVDAFEGIHATTLSKVTSCATLLEVDLQANSLKCADYNGCP
jgi:hypothetical protein